jgi:biopolymer transport protein ExbD
MPGKRKSRRTPAPEVGIEMTPMIDVVFQLLIYFIVTITPVDVAAHLDVFRPAAGRPPPEETTKPKMIQIDIYNGAITMNGASVNMDRLASTLSKLAAISTDQTVMIRCARDSKHRVLVEVLDACARTGMTNLSVASMN